MDFPKDRTRPPGFTLLEVMITMTLLTIVFVIVRSGTVAGLKHAADIRSGSQIRSMARTAMHRIHLDSTAAFIHGDAKFSTEKNETDSRDVFWLQIPTLAHARLTPRDTDMFPVVAEYRLTTEADGSRALFRRELSMQHQAKILPRIDWQLLAHGLKEVRFSFTDAYGKTFDTWPPPTVATKQNDIPLPIRVGYTLIFQKGHKGQAHIFHSESSIEATQ